MRINLSKFKGSIILSVLCALIFSIAVLLEGSASAENIDPDNDGSQYPYGENIGWLNAEPSGDGGPGALVSDSFITGYIWAENIGWVSLSCLNTSICSALSYGVLNDGAGNLSGYAWGENVGWINFAPTGSGVTIDPDTGIFSGKAWGENIGWISFNSSGPVSFSVVTSWRPPNSPPVANAGNDQIVECLGAGSAEVILNGTASTDPDGDTLTYTWTGSFGMTTGPMPTVNFGVGTHTVTLTVDDGNGGTATDTVLITVEDTTPPTVDAGPDVTLEATGPSGANYDVLTQVIAVDSCCALYFLISSAGPYPIGLTTVTVTATDCGLNSSSDTIIVTILDTTPPLVTVPTDVTVEATGPTTPVTLGSGPATDLVDGALTPTPDQTGPFAVGVHTIIWSATDSSGNTGTATQTVTVTDSAAPVFPILDDISAEATSAAGAVVNYEVIVNDIVDPLPGIICNPASGDTFAIGGTTVSCTATDFSGNSSIANFVVMVTASDIDGDGVPDVLDPCPGDVNNACNPDSSGAAIVDATSGGDVSTNDGTLIMMIPPNALNQDTTVSITETGTGGATFELTTNLGKALGVYGLEILPEGTTFAVPVTLVFAWDDINNDGTVDGTQIKEGNLRITKDGVAITEKCKFDPGCDPLANTFTVQVTSLSVFVLTFVDDEGPAVTSVTATPNPAEVYTPIMLVATLDDTLTGGSNIASAEYNVDNGSYLPMTAQDGLFNSVVEQVKATFPAFTNVGVHSLCVRGMDQFRNVVGLENCVVLSALDTIAPAVTAPLDITVEATGHMTPVILGTGSATDIVDGVLTPTPDQTGPFEVGTHAIVWSATDAAGNTGSATQTVTVVDTRAPVAFNVVLTPNPASVDTTLALTATVDDLATGGSNVTLAEYSIDGGAFTSMNAADGAFNSATENVTVVVAAFNIAGVHNICVRGTDAAGNIGDTDCIFLAVYDPDGGYVTGGGWINSPDGACLLTSACQNAAGKANFGFMSKYKKGATIPTGETEFRFKAGDLNFHSSVYQWLVVAGARGQYKGSGTINGAGDYGFMLTAIDGQINGGGGEDKFRIKIWDKNNNEAIVYDNQVIGDTGDDAEISTVIGGGSIVIHTAK